MMSVGDYQFFVRHFALDRLDYAWIGDRPQAVNDVVFVTNLHLRLSPFRAIQQRTNSSGPVAVKPEQLPGMRFFGPEKFRPVGFWPGKRLFIAENNAGG